MRTDTSCLLHRFVGFGAVGVVTAVGLSIGGCAVGDKRPQPAPVTAEVGNDNDQPPEIITQEERDAEEHLLTTRQGYEDADGTFILHGKLTNYWQNGRKKSEVHYVHGVRQGPRTAWYQNGQVWSSGAYLDDREDGTWTVWFPDGRKAQEYHFRKGAWDGLNTEWHENGQKKLEREWVNGKIQGTVTKWDEGGNVISQVEYRDSVAQP